MYIQSSIKKVKVAYTQGETENLPINTDFVSYVSRDRIANGYGNTHPVIRFGGIGVDWTYDEGDEKTRDREYMQILNLLECVSL